MRKLSSALFTLLLVSLAACEPPPPPAKPMLWHVDCKDHTAFFTQPEGIELSPGKVAMSTNTATVARVPRSACAGGSWSAQSLVLTAERSGTLFVYTGTDLAP